MSAFSEQFIEDFSVATRLAISNHYSPEEMKNIEVEIRFVNKQCPKEEINQVLEGIEVAALIVLPSLTYGCYAGEGPGCIEGQHYGSS
jgi:hypothetical protein